MTLATPLEEVVTETATMTAVAVEVMVVDVIMIVVTEDDVMIVTADMAEIVTTMLLVESTATRVMIDTAVAVMIDVGVVEATPAIAMRVVVTVAQLVMPHPQPPMVIQLHEASPGNHTEVEASMKIDLSVVNIDC
jgi:hypothetical protein